MTPHVERSNQRILIIDDNPAIHDDIRKILISAEIHNPSLEHAKATLFGESTTTAQGSSFQIDSAFQGEEGLSLVRRALESGQPYAVAFVDVRMPPGWDGVTTIGHLWKVDPFLQVVICTAFSDYPWEEIVRKLGKSSNLVILKKPFDNIEVLQMSHALAEKWRLTGEVRSRLADLDELVRQRTHDLESANEQLRREISQRALVEQTLRQAQKMEAVGQLAAGIAHDFNNILTVILGHISLLSEAALPKDVDESVREIQDSAERAAGLVRQLLSFSRKQVLQPMPLDLGEVIGNLGSVLGRLLGEPITLQVQPASGLPQVKADLRMMEQILFNLAVNARDAMPRGGSLAIAVSEVHLDSANLRPHSDARPGQHVCLSVTDTGCGIPADVLPRIFEPFFTTKEPGQGTGLGLASVYGIVKQHSGWVEVESEVNRGTTFRLFFPACRSEQTTDGEPAASEPIAGGHETVLVVEDDPAVRRLATDILQRYGYHVLEAESGVEALAMGPELVDQLDLLLTDLVMPGGVSGRDLAVQFQQRRPSLKVIYMTGYNRNIAVTEDKPFEEFYLLAKPFSTADLLRTVRQCLGQKA